MRPIACPLCGLFSCHELAHAQHAPTNWSANKIEQLTASIEQKYTAGEFNGCVLLAEKGVMYSNGFWAIPSLLQSNCWTHKLPFCSGSVSKQFMAMGIMQLHQDGKLNCQLLATATKRPERSLSS